MAEVVCATRASSFLELRFEAVGNPFVVSYAVTSAPAIQFGEAQSAMEVRKRKRDLFSTCIGVVVFAFQIQARGLDKVRELEGAWAPIKK